MSYSPLGPLPIGKSQIDIAKKQARFVGCPDNTVSNMLNCLKTVPAETLGNSKEMFEVG